MVNYRRVVCEVALLAAAAVLVTAAPTPDCATKHYDQRQNGTDNFRLNIDGMVIAVAPAESMLAALGDLDDLMDLAMEEYNTDYKPKPPQGSSSSSPSIQVVSLPVPEVKPQDDKEKPAEQKPQDDKEKPTEEKPQDLKPAEPAKPAEVASPLSDVSMGNELKIQKKDASLRKQEKAQRLKHRLASFLMPLLRKTRHH